MVDHKRCGILLSVMLAWMSASSRQTKADASNVQAPVPVVSTQFYVLLFYAHGACPVRCVRRMCRLILPSFTKT